MSLVTADDADLFRRWTVDDLAHLPDDGNRYELLNGRLAVSPSPIPRHQTATFEIGVLLRAACPREMQVLVAPIDYQITSDTSFQPDVVVMRRADVNAFVRPLRGPAELVVEIISKGSRKMDLEEKPPAYARSGVQHYWTFDPLKLQFVARRRSGARYVEVAEASGEQRIRLDEPFPVGICPEEIVNG
jgi:Uma2 family endonuclease